MRIKISVGEIDSAQGRALVDERYAALRPQIPIIYLLAVVNLCGLQLTTGEGVSLGWNLPTILVVCAAVRSAQWFRSSRVTPTAMLRQLQQTFWLAVLLCLSVSLWSLHLLTVVETEARTAVILFGGLTAVGVAFGLSALPSAACVPLIVLALPLAAAASMSRDPHLIGAALSLAVVAALILRLLSLHSGQFVNVVRSRETISRQQEQAEVARQEAVLAATTDFLTQLPNRRAFVSAVQGAINEGRGDPNFAVAVLDLNRFKAVNDTFGHACGDDLLKTVAGRLLRVALGKAYVARLGGDEFGMLFHGVARSSDLTALGEAILAEVNRPAIICGRQLTVLASCGLAMSRSGKSTPSDAMADADLALYEAKARSGLHLAVFQSQMEAPRRRRTEIERALQSPGVHETIGIAFQPIVDLQNGRLVANEALARWHHEGLGDVSPAEFVPVAECLEIIDEISDHLFEEAVAAAADWHPSVRLSFNLSAVQLCSGGIAERILATLAKTSFPGERLQVEVTETALLSDFPTARANLGALRAVGTSIVLDDFGAGYASIGYLREIQFDQIKLDGALVTAAVVSREGERLLGAVIELCKALGVSTVAEHIETEEQLKLLLRLDCRFGQGYWLYPPLPPAQVRELSCHEALKATNNVIVHHRSAA